MRRFRLAVALAMGILSVSAAFGFVLTTISSSSLVIEPITVATTVTLATGIFPGQFSSLTFTVSNLPSAPAYGITITETHSFPSGVSIASVLRNGAPYTLGTKVTLFGGTTDTFTINIAASKDAATGSVSITVSVDRSAPPP